MREDYLIDLGYSCEAIRYLSTHSDRRIDVMQNVIDILGCFDYYRIESGTRLARTISEAVADGRLTCFESSLLAHDLATMIHVSGKVMAMSRYDPRDKSYLGHTAFIYATADLMFGAISLSRYASQGNRSSIYASEEDVVLSYAHGYADLGMIPLAFGMVDLWSIQFDWRRSSIAMLQLHEYLLDSQNFSFTFAKGGNMNGLFPTDF